MAVINNKPRPPRKKISATFSSFSPLPAYFLIERNDRIQLIMNITIAIVASSSTNVAALISSALIEVSTTKQSPSRVADVFNICAE